MSAGIAATVWGLAPTGGRGGGSPARWAAIGGAIALAAVVLAAIGRRRPPLLRASLYAAGAALAFALSSAFLADTVAGFAAHGIGGLLLPAPYGLTLASFGGLFLIQSAFQAAPLAVTMPMVDWVEPLVGVVLGVTVLGESLDTAPGHVLALGVGAAVALAGIVVLDTSPKVRALQRPAVESGRETGEARLAEGAPPGEPAGATPLGPTGPGRRPVREVPRRGALPWGDALDAGTCGAARSGDAPRR